MDLLSKILIVTKHWLEFIWRILHRLQLRLLKHQRENYLQRQHLHDGVPKPHSPIPLEFLNIAGSLCGELLPTGNQADTLNGVNVTMIDNGMPCVIISAKDLGISGYEDIKDLESNKKLRDSLENLRLKCGKLMNLGDVTDKTVPKMTIVSHPKSGGIINTRTFIPHRCHSSIGVFGAITVATACLLNKSVPTPSVPSHWK